MTPIYQTSTYVQEGLGRHKGYEYARTQNPTREALERNVASLEGGEHGFAFGSGTGGARRRAQAAPLGRPRGVRRQRVRRHPSADGAGLHRVRACASRFVDMRDIANVERAVTPATRMIYCETPTNPMMNLVDLAAVGDLTQARGLPLRRRQHLRHARSSSGRSSSAADIVLHSTTKYLNGHSDMVGRRAGDHARRSCRAARLHSERGGRRARADGLLARAARHQDAPAPHASARRQRARAWPTGWRSAGPRSRLYYPGPALPSRSTSSPAAR